MATLKKQGKAVPKPTQEKAQGKSNNTNGNNELKQVGSNDTCTNVQQNSQQKQDQIPIVQGKLQIKNLMLKQQSTKDESIGEQQMAQIVDECCKRVKLELTNTQNNDNQFAMAEKASANQYQRKQKMCLEEVISIEQVKQMISESQNELKKQFIEFKTEISNEIKDLRYHQNEFRVFSQKIKLHMQQFEKAQEEKSSMEQRQQAKQVKIQKQQEISELELKLKNIETMLSKVQDQLKQQQNDVKQCQAYSQKYEQSLQLNAQSKSSDIQDKQLVPVLKSDHQQSQNMIEQEAVIEQKQSKGKSEQQELIRKQLYNQTQKKKVSSLINKLYDLSCRKRVIPEEFKAFVGSKQDYQGLLNEYDATGEFQQQLGSTLLDGFRRIRGDGNCLYTSFVFQYLLLILTNWDYSMFDKFMNDVKTMRFELIYEEGFIIPKADEKYLKEEFMHRLQILRNSDNKEKDLEKAFSTDQDIFYGLAIIYLRNLVYQLSQQDQHAQALFSAINVNFHQDVITWESQWDQNEIVIDLLARHLGFEIIVYFIQNQNCQQQEYGVKGNNKMLLILQPGHYQIGIENKQSRSNDI